MKTMTRGRALLAVAIAAAALATACGTTYVVLPHTAIDPPATDTLLARRDGNDVTVTVYYDTLTLTRTVTRVDTLWMEGSRTVVHVDTVRVPVKETVVRVDTVRVPDPRTVVRVDTVRVPVGRTIVRVDTVRIPVTTTVVRVDTVRVPVKETVVRVDTVRIPTREKVVRVDTVRVAVTDTLFRTDTIRVAVADTVFRTDTVRMAVTDTVRVPGRRLLFLPPGHFPPEGQCRIWIHGLPPGQQARAAECDALGEIPAGAFILFGGDAWDFDYDWHAEAARGSEAVPPQILALKRRNAGPPRRKGRR